MSHTPDSTIIATSSSSWPLCPPTSNSTATDKTLRTFTRCRSNAISMQRPLLSREYPPSKHSHVHFTLETNSPLSGPPKLSLLIPSTTSSASRQFAYAASAASHGASARYPTSSNSSGSDPFGSDSPLSPSRQCMSSLPRAHVPDSLPSHPRSFNPYSSSRIQQKRHTPHSSPLPATTVAHTILSRHISNSTHSPRGSPWGPLGSACGRRRYVRSALRVEVC